MKLPKPIAVIVMLLGLCTSVKAQLWSYINSNPESEKAAERRIEREASSVKEVPIVVYGDSLSYTVITYDLRSFDGKLYRITTSQKPFTKRLNISLGNDSLVFVDVMGMDSVHFLNKSMLEILYSPRGGSDDGYQNTIILCIDNGKLHVAMEIESDHQFDGPGLWGEYFLTAKFSGQNENNYRFFIKTNDRYYSKTHPKKNHDLNAQHIIRFDAKKKIFYNVYKNVDAVIYELVDRDGKTSEKHIKGNYPAIKLGNREYYYVNNVWYAAYRSGGKIELNQDME